MLTNNSTMRLILKNPIAKTKVYNKMSVTEYLNESPKYPRAASSVKVVIGHKERLANRINSAMSHIEKRFGGRVVTMRMKDNNKVNMENSLKKMKVVQHEINDPNKNLNILQFQNYCEQIEGMANGVVLPKKKAIVRPQSSKDHLHQMKLRESKTHEKFKKLVIIK